MLRYNIYAYSVDLTFIFKWVIKLIYDYRDDKELAFEMDDEVREKYPHHADEARKLISNLLYHYDKHRWLVFKGQAADKYFQLGELQTTQLYISSLLESRDLGQPVSDLHIQTGIRTCLGLPFAVVNGSKLDE